MKTRECSNFSKWREEILEHCRSGIDEVNIFIKANPTFYFVGLEQIKQEFYEVINCLE